MFLYLQLRVVHSFIFNQLISISCPFSSSLLQFPLIFLDFLPLRNVNFFFLSRVIFNKFLLISHVIYTFFFRITHFTSLHFPCVSILQKFLTSIFFITHVMFACFVTCFSSFYLISITLVNIFFYQVDKQSVKKTEFSLRYDEKYTEPFRNIGPSIE